MSVFIRGEKTERKYAQTRHRPGIFENGALRHLTILIVSYPGHKRYLLALGARGRK